MRAVVLVGGFGTRLRPLTLQRPKQMLPVLDRPMIEWVTGWLAGNGVDEVVLSLGYRPEAFTEAYPDGTCAGVRLRYAVEPEPLDTAGAVRFAALAAGLDRADEPFLVVNGDVLTTLDIGALVALHRARGAEGTIALTPVEDPSRYGVVPIEADGRVVAFIEKPPRDQAPSNWINAGTYVLEPSVLGRIPDGRKVSIERETFPAMVAEGRLYALQSDASWVDAGTPATYLSVQLDLAARTGWQPSGVTVEPGAVLDGAVLRPGATVEAGATVRRSVIGRDARIGAGAAVTDSIVGDGARIGAGARLDGLCVIGDGIEVAAGAQLSGQLVPAPQD